MELPPKNDDVSGSDKPKKTVRKTTRTSKAKASPKAAAQPAAEAPVRAPEPARQERAERPEKPERQEKPERAEKPQRSEQPPRDEAPPAAFNRQENFQREQRPERPEPPPSPPAAESAPSTGNGNDSDSSSHEQDGRSSNTPDQPATGAQNGGQGNQGGGAGGQGGGGQPSQGHGGGGQGQWDDRGGGDRGFWKRNKRKRGRHGGGHWQPGGGNGGGGGGSGGGGSQPHSQHPPQPPPPTPAPTYGDLPDPARFNDLESLKTLAADISSGTGDSVYLDELYALPLAELTSFARKFGVTFDNAPNRKQLLAQVLALAATGKRAIRDRGYIDMTDRGAFIVHEHVNYRLYPEDAYLPETLIRHYGLKRGHKVEVAIQAPQNHDRCPAVVRIESVMGGAPDEISKVTPFEELIPYYPLQRILLESEETQKDVSMRAVDILTPIGFGQRGLIVAPPRTGKTVLLQNIANSVTANSPHAKLILLLIDERPEEVTDFRRHTKGEVVSSTFDETPESHVHCAEMVIEKARRMVEQGDHVIILLDSITRLARAYNALTGNQGKTMSGGLESNALQKPKRFFGSARNIEGGGSLTIIASALVDTGSRMDEIIFEEFKGTGNSELHLDRGLVERRIFPAINIDRSGTRKEELIYHPDELQRIYGLRRAMQGLGPIESMEMLITRLKKTKSNAEFLMSLR
ncbi:MAG: transcription termination factor Rho [Verrucomicrobia bacterium]|nr:transcription termination factor Rho [Verrucomicrobiota bacterium]